MIGTWDNLFGIRGFDVSNIVASIAFNPLFCAVDLCISGFGIGFDLAMGPENIEFYGYVEVPHLEKIFVEAGISGKNPYNLALSFKSIAIQWNKMIGKKTIQINTNDIPADWGLKNMYFYIAPEAGNFGNKYYDAGFWFSGGFRLIGIDCNCNVKVANDDFHFAVNMSIDSLAKDINKFLHIAIVKNPAEFVSWTDDMKAQLVAVNNGQMSADSFHIVSIHNVSITGFSMDHFATQNDPVFIMDYSFLGRHTFKATVPLFHWFKEFENFFDFFLKNLFH